MLSQESVRVQGLAGRGWFGSVQGAGFGGACMQRRYGGSNIERGEVILARTHGQLCRVDVPERVREFSLRFHPSGKCSYERPILVTVCGTMRSMCGADAGCSALNHSALCDFNESPNTSYFAARQSTGILV